MWMVVWRTSWGGCFEGEFHDPKAYRISCHYSCGWEADRRPAEWFLNAGKGFL